MAKPEPYEECLLRRLRSASLGSKTLDRLPRVLGSAMMCRSESKEERMKSMGSRRLVCRRFVSVRMCCWQGLGSLGRQQTDASTLLTEVHSVMSNMRQCPASSKVGSSTSVNTAGRLTIPQVAETFRKRCCQGLSPIERQCVSSGTVGLAAFPTCDLRKS